MSATPYPLRRNFLVVDDTATVRDVRDRVLAGRDVPAYVVVALAAGGFAVLGLSDLIDALKAIGPTLRPEILAMRLGNVSQLIPDHRVGSVEEAELDPGRLRSLFQKSPHRPWVVVAAGRIAGVLAAEAQSATETADLSWFGGESRPAAEPRRRGRSFDAPAPGAPLAPQARPAPADHVEEAPPIGLTAPAPRPAGAVAPPAGEVAMGVDGHPRVQPGTLATEPAAESPPRPAIGTEPERRWINAELEGRGTEEPLRVGETFTIAFDVDIESRKRSLLAEPLIDGNLFSGGEETIDLTVQLASQDFEILTREPQTLRLARHGKSRNKARFDLSPIREGEGVLNALFLKNGNFVQLLTLRLQTGKAPDQAVSSSRTLGRTLDASLAIQPRDVTLVLTKTADGFQAILSKAVTAIATLPITEPQLDQMIAQARDELRGIVQWTKGSGDPVYQAGIDIPPDVHSECLRILARAGFRLFQQMFYGPAADAESRLLGDRLRTMAGRETLKIQILSQKFLLPWGILYLADSFDEDRIDPELFLGFKHIVEHIPLQPAMDVMASTIDSRPLLNVSVNVNTDIDEQMGIPVIAGQLEYWNAFSDGPAKVVVRRTRDEVRAALADSSSPDQLLYFYCHAVSQPLSAPGGPDTSAIVLTGNGRLTLGDLQIAAPAGRALAGAPLVFVNACESAELSPLFYDGFVPYFMARGARGVIGTECETPALFAAEWARRFFDRFLAGEPVGGAFLALRREFYARHNNVLGILYALYCDGDTQIAPAVARSGGADGERPRA